MLYYPVKKTPAEVTEGVNKYFESNSIPSKVLLRDGNLELISKVGGIYRKMCSFDYVEYVDLYIFDFPTDDEVLKKIALDYMSATLFGDVGASTSSINVFIEAFKEVCENDNEKEEKDGGK